MADPVLAGDVGGTWTRLALYDGALHSQWKRRTRDLTSLEEAISTYLGEVSVQPVATAIGFAGPVVDGVASLTNGDLTAREDALPQPAVLLNDLAAAAHGVGALAPDAARRLSGPAPVPGAPRVVIGVGTGHGQAIWSNGVVLAGEGGHADFAASDPELVELAEVLRERLGRVSVECVVSGKGMDEVLRFAAGRAQLGAEATAALQTRSAAEVVAELASQDAACARARSLFARALGTEAGNAALRILPAGGVWLVGGVAEGIVQPGADAELTTAFSAKSPMSEQVLGVPLLVVQDSHVGLRGAAVVASMLVH